MAGVLVHRGPDADGCHVDGPIALGHRRLSIIDLSQAADQPLTNEDGSLWLVFNGEIYNFRELRRELEGRHRFRSEGDAETILHLYEERGDDGRRGARRHVRVRALGRARSSGCCSRATAAARSRSSTTTVRRSSPSRPR